MSGSIADLIAAEGAAFARFDNAMRATDCVRIGRDPTVAELQEYKAANEAQLAALSAVIEAEPKTGAEMCAIIDRFLEREVDQICVNATPEQITALMATVKRFATTVSMPHGLNTNGIGGAP